MKSAEPTCGVGVNKLSQVPPAKWIYGLLILSLALFGAIKAARMKTLDFYVYWRATQRFWQAADLYPASDTTMQFRYLPPASYLMSPWTLWSQHLGGILWALTLVVVLAATMHWLLPSRRENSGFVRSAWDIDISYRSWLPALAVLNVVPALFLELNYGQVNLAMLGMLVASSVLFRRGHSYWAGGAWVVAILFKPSAALFGLYLLIMRGWRVLAAAVAMSLLLWLPIVSMYGVDGTLAQLKSWDESITQTALPWLRAPNNQSLPALFAATFPLAERVTKAELWASQFASLFVFLAPIALWRPKPTHLFAAVCLGVALLSPHTWRQNFVLALPAIVTVLVGGPDPTSRRWGWGLLATILAFSVGLNLQFFSQIELYDILGAFRPYTYGYFALLCLCIWNGRQRYLGVK